MRQMAGKPAVIRESRQALLQREARHRFGAVNTRLAGEAVEAGQYRIAGDEFLMCSPDGIRLHYRKGAGITIDAPPDTDPAEIALWLGGTLRAAIASMNGLLPLHASAVAHGEAVIAFSGPSGAGKSTLVAALEKRGFALFCDDTLVIDPDSEAPQCLPGHKRLRLWQEGLELAAVEGFEQVAPSYPKRFASHAGSAIADALPIGALVFLQDGETLSLEPVEGAERFALLCDDHYTDLLHQQAKGMDRAARFGFQAGLAQKIPIFRLIRPFEAARFDDMVATIADWIEERAQK